MAAGVRVLRIDGAGQGGGDPPARLGARAQHVALLEGRLVDQREAVAALGQGEREAGAADDLVARDRRRRRADADGDTAAPTGQRRREPLEPGEHDVDHVRGDRQRELVAADPVGAAAEVPQHRGELAQALVAGVVAVQVVGLVEPDEVDEQDRGLGSLEVLGQVLVERAVVAELGQAVGARPFGEPGQLAGPARGLGPAVQDDHAAAEQDQEEAGAAAEQGVHDHLVLGRLELVERRRVLAWAVARRPTRSRPACAGTWPRSAPSRAGCAGRGPGGGDPDGGLGSRSSVRWSARTVRTRATSAGVPSLLRAAGTPRRAGRGAREARRVVVCRQPVRGDRGALGDDRPLQRVVAGDRGLLGPDVGDPVVRPDGRPGAGARQRQHDQRETRRGQPPGEPAAEACGRGTARSGRARDMFVLHRHEVPLR